MPDTGCLFLSGLSVALGIMLFMFPAQIVKVGDLLNRTLIVLDQPLLRYRYLMGLGLFVLAYGLVRLSLLLPAMRG